MATLYAAAVAANGLGGAAFHGPGDRTSKWIHDAALCATLGVLASVEPGRADRIRVPSVVAVAAGSAAIVAVRPGWTNAVSAGLAAGASARLGMAFANGHRPARPASLTAVTALAVALLANRSALPSSRLHQPVLRSTGHGWWHALTAISLAACGSIAFDRTRPRP